MDPASLYGQLGRLIETMPDLTPPGPYSADILMWLARAHALISEQHDAIDIAEIKTETEKAVKNVSDVMNPARKNSARLIASLVYRALALAELHAPANAQGAFIPAGNVFDAMAAVGKVLSGATGDLLIVDPYMDEKALTDFAPLASEKVSIRLLADQRGHKPTLRPASERWRSQYG